MPRVIPLISAATIAPLVRSLVLAGRNVQTYLDASDLGYWPAVRPEEPIPLLNVVEFLRAVAHVEGPDFPCRALSEASLLDLARFGREILGASSPRSALCRVQTIHPRHCTHEQISIVEGDDFVQIRHQMYWPFEQEALHLIQQYVAMMFLSLLRFTNASAPLISSLEMEPHPEFGFDLVRNFGLSGTEISPATSRVLVLTIPLNVFDHQFRKIARDRSVPRPDQDWPPMRGDGSLTHSGGVVVAAMLKDRPPTIERLARAAGTSVRSLQRDLTGEGTSFSALLDAARKDAALVEICSGTMKLRDIAAAVGFADQATLTRAVRRWTGATPRQLRGSDRPRTRSVSLKP